MYYENNANIAKNVSYFYTFVVFYLTGFEGACSGI